MVLNILEYSYIPTILKHWDKVDVICAGAVGAIDQMRYLGQYLDDVPSSLRFCRRTRNGYLKSGISNIV